MKQITGNEDNISLIKKNDSFEKKIIELLGQLLKCGSPVVNISPQKPAVTVNPQIKVQPPEIKIENKTDLKNIEGILKELATKNNTPGNEWNRIRFRVFRDRRGMMEEIVAVREK